MGPLGNLQRGPHCQSGLNEGSFSYEGVIDGINITFVPTIPSYKLRSLSPSQVAYQMTAGENSIRTIREVQFCRIAEIRVIYTDG